MKKKRVLLLIAHLGKGGAERVFHDHAVAFSLTHTVEEVVFEIHPYQRIYDSGLPLHDLKRKNWLSRLGPVGRLLSRSLALRKLVARGLFDVVISHMDGANWVNVLSFSRARKILVVHGTVLRDQNVSPLIQWLRLHLIFPWLYNLADCTVAVSAGIARELQLVGRVRKVQAIVNYFDLAAIVQQAQIALAPETEAVFMRPGVLVTSGRLAEQKKQSYLLEIVAALLRRGVDTRLVILGDGDLRDSLLLRCSELKLKTYHAWDNNAVCHGSYDVYFLGYVSNPYAYLARSTLFLFPSGWEGFPLALCEAMICGLPVISADCPTGPREILAPDTVRDTYDLRVSEWAKNGVLMPMLEQPHDLVVWVDTVQKLLADPGLRGQLATRGTTAMAGLDRNTIVPKWHKLIESVSDAE